MVRKWSPGPISLSYTTRPPCENTASAVAVAFSIIEPGALRTQLAHSSEAQPGREAATTIHWAAVKGQSRKGAESIPPFTLGGRCPPAAGRERSARLR
jgi:hypothetical protein